MNSKDQKAKDLEDTMTGAYNDYEKALNRHSYFKVHNHELGEDLVQDTYMKTWAYLLKGGKIELMRAFLYHTLNCLIIDEYRKKKSSSLDVLIDKGFEPGTSDTERLVNALDGKAALLLIARLPPKYQIIMHMRYIQSLSLSEMSEVTGQTKNAMAVQVHRGMEKLKVLYHH
ncbi:MAG: RNA polymerase sigma factor [Patescibacteria group bacterium]